MEHKFTVYSNYDVVDDYGDNAKDDLWEAGNDNPTDEEIYERSLIIAEDEWENLINGVLCDDIDVHKYIATGTLGLWDGNYSGWTILENAHDFYDLIKDCGFVEVTDNDGLIEIKCSHHDGTNYFTLKALTTDGYDFYREQGWDMEDSDLGKLLFENEKYSRKPALSWEY